MEDKPRPLQTPDAKPCTVSALRFELAEFAVKIDRRLVSSEHWHKDHSSSTETSSGKLLSYFNVPANSGQGGWNDYRPKKNKKEGGKLEKGRKPAHTIVP